MTPTVLLISAMLGLGLGPVLFALLHRSPAPQRAVDGFVLVSVVGLVMLHVLPDAYEVAGIWALLVAAIGLLLPLMAEKVRALSHRASHGLVLGAAFAGLMLHASLDGVGLGGSEGLGLAVVLHRVPVGLGVWWLVRPQFGRRWAVAVLGALCVATVLGFVFQTTFVEHTGMIWVQLVQALVAGSLLHVLLHQSVGFHDHDTEAVESQWRVPGAIGAILGALLVAGLPDAHEHAFGERILDVVFVASPYMLGAFVLSVAFVRGQVLRIVDTATPWAVGAVVLAATMVEVHAEIGVVSVISSVLFGGIVVLGLAHRGPRDFLLEVLPLDVLQGTHRHEHVEASPQAELSHP